jgi:hypothetical protein
MFAFCSRSRATYRSFGEASGSSRMDRSCFRCDGRSRWAMSRKAVRLSSVGEEGSPERLPGFHAALGDLPVGGLVVPERQQIRIGELSHELKLRTVEQPRLA